MRRVGHSQIALAGILAVACSGCGLLAPVRVEPSSIFALEATIANSAPKDALGQPLVVAVPQARPAFDSARMVYVSKTYEVRFFAKNQWVDTPARMLAPLLVQALGTSGRFQAVRSGAGVDAALRLETEITALQQEFTVVPSRVRFGLRAQLVDLAEHRIVAVTDLESVEQAPSDDPYGGVVAANRALQRLLPELSSWCEQSAPVARSASGAGDSRPAE